MSVKIGKEVSIVAGTTGRVKYATLTLSGSAQLEAIRECEFEDGDVIEGKVEIDPRTGKVGFNLKVFK